jgi:hypothetical protein
MAQEQAAQPAGHTDGHGHADGNGQTGGHGHAGGKETGSRQAPDSGASPDGEESVPTSHSYNQARDEPIPASHDDDGRPEPGEESPSGAGQAGGAVS